MQLVINTPGTFITQKDECFRLKQKDQVFDISPLKVESIVISNQAMISTQAIILALEHNIDTIFMGFLWVSNRADLVFKDGKHCPYPQKATGGHGQPTGVSPRH